MDMRIRPATSPIQECTRPMLCPECAASTPALRQARCPKTARALAARRTPSPVRLLKHLVHLARTEAHCLKHVKNLNP